ncbi:MAG: hypothetical protein J5674_00910 [Candidatus Methanomethylophilaceae archaeon]|nr:hypothetical protein [Candidatus Methanomethylophilaceae archaeon]
MRGVPVSIRMYGATAAVCLASVALSVGSMTVLDGTGGLEARHAMAFVSVPYAIGAVALSFSCSTSMRLGWNSFLVSSGVGRKGMMRSLHSFALAIYSAVLVFFALASVLFTGRIGTAIVSCACIAMAVSVSASAVGIMSYSMSGSSLMTDLTGAIVPMILAMASYISFIDGAFEDVGLALMCLVAALAIVAVCLRASMNCFRRLDL